MPSRRRTRRPSDEQRAYRERLVRERAAQRLMADLPPLPDEVRQAVDECLAAVVRLGTLAARRFTGGRPLQGDAEAAKRAWLAELRKGNRMKVANLTAMQAGGFRAESRIYELRKAGDWDAELSAGIDSANLRGGSPDLAPSFAQSTREGGSHGGTTDREHEPRPRGGT